MASNINPTSFRTYEKQGDRAHFNEIELQSPASTQSGLNSHLHNVSALSASAFMEPVDDAFLDSLEGHWGELEAIHETVSNTVASLQAGPVPSNQRVVMPQNMFSHLQNSTNPLFSASTAAQIFNAQMAGKMQQQSCLSIARDSGSDNQNDSGARKRKRNGPMSQEERAVQNRDRNREHARNTRLRKKAFVDELKKQVQDLAAAREREERERHLECQRSAAMTEIRYQVLETFLDYRGRGEEEVSLWYSILDENFKLKMPITPYYSFPQSQIHEGSRQLKGVEDIIRDTAGLQTMYANLGKGTEKWNRCMESPNPPKSFTRYEINRKDMLVQGDMIMASWKMQTVNAVERGAVSELELFGMLRCSFNKFNKLFFMELIFDVYSMIEQLKKLTVVDAPQIPKIVHEALPVSHDPVLLKTLVDDLLSRRVTSAIINYSDQNVPTKSYLRVYPLSNEGENVTHFIGVLEKVHTAEEENENISDAEGASSDRTSSSAQSSQYRSTPPEGPDQDDSWGEESSDKQESTSSGGEENEESGQTAGAHESTKSHRGGARGSCSNSCGTTSEAGSSSSRENNGSNRPSGSGNSPSESGNSSPLNNSYRGGNSGSDASGSSYGQHCSDASSDRNGSGSEDGSAECLADTNTAASGSEDGNGSIQDECSSSKARWKSKNNSKKEGK